MSKVSFVIPVYNGDSYLAETLESIRNQSLKDIEIIVVNDCSPDYTDDLMEWYQKHEPRLKYHKFEENQGVCAARNKGNELSEAPIICVSDQDDISTKHRALFSYNYLTRHPEVDCLTSAYYNCNVDGQIIEKITPVDMTKEAFDAGTFQWFHSSCSYRKKDIMEMPYRVVDGETDDYVFLKDWTEKGKKFKTLKKVLGSCRRVPWGVMQQRRARIGAQPSYVL